VLPVRRGGRFECSEPVWEGSEGNVRIAFGRGNTNGSPVLVCGWQTQPAGCAVQECARSRRPAWRKSLASPFATNLRPGAPTRAVATRSCPRFVPLRYRPQTARKSAWVRRASTRLFASRLPPSRLGHKSLWRAISMRGYFGAGAPPLTANHPAQTTPVCGPAADQAARWAGFQTCPPRPGAECKRAGAPA